MRIAPILFATVWAHASAFASDPHPALPAPVIPDCLGVNIHFTDPKPGELEMLSAAGFKWVRMDLTWAAIERKSGEYDFSAYDRLVAALEQHKLRAIFILDYGNPLYAEPGDKQPFTSRVDTDEFRQAFARWAIAAVRHFKGHGYLWEMWNEPNGDGFWKPKADVRQYIALARATGKALRAAGLLGQKGEAFIGPATSTIDRNFLEGCFQADLLEFWDAVSVHPYRQSAPESVVEEYQALRKLIDKYAPAGKLIPIISGNETDPEHRFGLVQRKYYEGRNPVFDPKPAYRAVQALQSPAVLDLLRMGALEPVVRETPVGGLLPLREIGEKITNLTADGDPQTASTQRVEIASPGPVTSPVGPQAREITTLTYHFEAGWKFIRVASNEEIPSLAADNPAPARKLGVWLYGDGKGCQARIRFVDSTGQCFQGDGPKIDWQGWRYATFPLLPSGASPLAHWAGANDGQIHYPIKWDTIFLLDNISRQPVEGTIHLSAPTLIY